VRSARRSGTLLTSSPTLSKFEPSPLSGSVSAKYQQPTCARLYLAFVGGNFLSRRRLLSGLHTAVRVHALQLRVSSCPSGCPLPNTPPLRPFALPSRCAASTTCPPPAPGELSPPQRECLARTPSSAISHVLSQLLLNSVTATAKAARTVLQSAREAVRVQAPTRTSTSSRRVSLPRNPAKHVALELELCAVDSVLERLRAERGTVAEAAAALDDAEARGASCRAGGPPGRRRGAAARASH